MPLRVIFSTVIITGSVIAGLSSNKPAAVTPQVQPHTFETQTVDHAFVCTEGETGRSTCPPSN